MHWELSISDISPIPPLILRQGPKSPKLGIDFRFWGPLVSKRSNTSEI